MTVNSTKAKSTTSTTSEVVVTTTIWTTTSIMHIDGKYYVRLDEF